MRTITPLTPIVPATATDLELLSINTVRTLAMDAVQAAESGHPGTPMALAPLAYVLYTRYARHNPADPAWPDRDRIVLSCGHASMLLYASLHLSGYDVSLDDIRAFRQWGSKTPGHPEHGHTAGVETTTGPLGQGFATAVGMAIAEQHLAATFNRPDHTVVDHTTWVIASDGDLMEGISHEAASLAGHLGLGKLIVYFDDNAITIDGSTALSCSDDVAGRFEACGWQVLRVDDVNDLDALDTATDAARKDTARPSLVIVKSVIGYGSPNRAGSAKAHGEALGAAEIAAAKAQLGWPYAEPFTVPDEARAHWMRAASTGAQAHDAWRRALIAYAKAHPDAAKEFGRRMQRDLPGGWESALPVFTAENGSVASRAASGTVINALAPRIPELIGGSADLAGSNNTVIRNGGNFAREERTGRNIHFGIREHAMAAALNGLALHGGIIPFAGTFLVFADYMRPAIRLAALMKQHVIYVFTHDSIGLGEDGPTHQPIEHLTALRCIPGLTVVRPADANEVAEAWRLAIAHRNGPVALIFSRQKLPLIDRSVYAAAKGVARGAYVLADAPDARPQLVIIATGSEVQLALGARETLSSNGIKARVVSMPSQEVFAAQPDEYRDSVLPPDVPRIAVEAAHPMSWHRWVGERGTIIGLDDFGASAPFARVYTERGLTVERIVETARGVIR